MPAENTDLHVMYTMKEAYFITEYYLMDTEGNYPVAPTQTEREYKCGLGSQINQTMINAMAESSGLPLTIDGERVRYLERAIVTTHQNAGTQIVFQSTVDENGKVTPDVGPHITKEDETSKDKPYKVAIYIARREYTVTLTAGKKCHRCPLRGHGRVQTVCHRHLHLRCSGYRRGAGGSRLHLHLLGPPGQPLYDERRGAVYLPGPPV